MEIDLLRPRRRRAFIARTLAILAMLVVLSAAAGFAALRLWQETTALERSGAAIVSEADAVTAARKRTAPSPRDLNLVQVYQGLHDAIPDMPAVLRTVSQALPQAGKLSTLTYQGSSQELILEGSLPDLQSLAAYMQALNATGHFAAVVNPAATNLDVPAAAASKAAPKVPAAGPVVQFTLKLQLAKKGATGQP